MTKLKVTTGLCLLVCAYVGGYLTKRCPPVSVKSSETSKETSASSWQEKATGTEKSQSEHLASAKKSKTLEWFRPDGSLSKRLVLGEVQLSQSRDVTESSVSRSAAGNSITQREASKVVSIKSGYDLGLVLSLGLYQDARTALGRTFAPTLVLSAHKSILGPLNASLALTHPATNLHLNQTQVSVGLSLTFLF